MTSVIYWFSGTGNSLHAAKRLAEHLDDCRLRPMTEALAEGGVEPKESRVGLVFPMYFEGLPKIVRRFCGKLRTDGVEYVFGLVTSGGGPSWALHDLRDALDGRLDAGFVVPMVGNYIALYDVPSDSRAASKLSSADETVEETARTVTEGGRGLRGDTPVLGWLLHRMLHGRWAADAAGRDVRFASTDACTSCGTCAAVCPVGNISLEEGAPAWHHRCEVCMACIHWCPEAAIEYGKKTPGRGRYHHPDVSLEDVLVQAAPASGDGNGEGRTVARNG